MAINVIPWKKTLKGRVKYYRKAAVRGLVWEDVKRITRACSENDLMPMTHVMLMQPEMVWNWVCLLDVFLYVSEKLEQARLDDLNALIELQKRLPDVKIKGWRQGETMLRVTKFLQSSAFSLLMEWIKADFSALSEHFSAIKGG